MPAGSIQQLIQAFSRLPGVGPKTAERFVMYLLKSGRGEVTRLTQALQEILQGVRSCEICHDFTEQSPCYICRDAARDQTTICVVAEPTDVVALEKIGTYRGTYHVLRGLLRPLDGIGPENIKSEELLCRVATGNITEIIFALNPTIEGETTVQFLRKALTEKNIKLTRLATGLPAGGTVEYADDITLGNALRGRRQI